MSAPLPASAEFTARCQAAACRVCGAQGLSPVLDLGSMPLSDGFLRPEQLERPLPRYPLEVAFCPDCTLVQILETVPPEELFCRDYPYYASVSSSWVEHCRRSALALIEERGLGANHLVVELASNDGYMLRNFVERGIPVLGIDPAEGPARQAEAAGIPTRVAFFGRELAEELRRDGVRADLVLGNNVLAHVADTNGFVAGIGRILADDGVAVLEMPYLVDLIERREFDTIYHEHLCYFSVSALERLFSRHGLHLVQVDRIPTHGGSLRVRVSPRQPEARPGVEALLAAERRAGVDQAGYYQGFARTVEGVRSELLALLRRLRGEGKRVAAYGAAAKGTILLNYLGLDRRTIEYAVDKNPHKQGKLIPGAGIPIASPDRLRTDRPDYLLLLPWNLRQEVLAQQQEFLASGGRFIIPLPRPYVVGPNAVRGGAA